MPSGRTHDRITLWTLPILTGGVLLATRSPSQALLFSGTYLFGGMMLSPDLDIRSRPYKRWGIMRWMWLPYQRAMHHRSMLSHGPILGTVFRLAYLGAWLLLFWVIGVIAIAQITDPKNWQTLSMEQIDQGLLQLKALMFEHPSETLMLFLGLEFGGMSHALSDWGGSSWKRFQRKRLKKTNKRRRKK